MLYRILASSHRFSWLFILIVLCYIGYHIVLYLLENVDIRFTRLLQYLQEDPAVFFINGDYRLCVSFFSIKGFIDDWGMPHGFGCFNKYMERVVENPTYAPFVSPSVLGARKRR